MLIPLIAILLIASDPEPLHSEWIDCLVDETEERAHDLTENDDAIVSQAFAKCIRWERSLRTIVALYYDADPDEQMRIWREGARPHLLDLVAKTKEIEALYRKYRE